MGVGHDLAVRRVDAWVVGVLSVTGFESVVLGVVWGVECAADTVKHVFTVVGSIGFRRITGLEAESITAHKVSPFDDLNELTGPDVRKDDTTHRVTTEISTVRVHFTSVVVSGHVNLGLVNEANDLDVVRGFQVLNTGDGFSRNKTCPATWVCTPGNHLAFYFANSLAWFWWSPEAEVTRTIDISCLAERRLVFGGRITNIVSDLGATNETFVCVNFVRQLSWGVVVL